MEAEDSMLRWLGLEDKSLKLDHLTRLILSQLMRRRKVPRYWWAKECLWVWTEVDGPKDEFF